MIENLKPSLSKRLLSVVIDLVLFLILMFIFSNFVINPIIQNTTDYQNQYQIYEDKLVSSGLAVKDENNTLQIAFYNYNTNEVDNYDKILVEFYTNFDASKATENLTKYQNSKKDYGDLFIYDEQTNIYTFNKENLDNSQTFFISSFNDALNYLLNNDNEYANSYKAISFYMNLSKYLSVFVAALIPFMIIPLFLKGKSVGKLVMKLEVKKISNELEDVKLSNICLRSLALIIIEVVGSYLIYGIPALISLFMIMGNKNGMSLHDYIAKTCVIDKTIPQEKTENVIEVEASIKD